MSALLEVIERQRTALAATKQPIPADPWEFATKCCITVDAAQAGKAALVRPFPAFDYLRDVIAFLHANRFYRIDKSGQLLVSWAVIIYRLWCVLTMRGYRYAYYCGTQSKAEEHIKDRFWGLYERIPAIWAKPPAKLVNGQFLVYHDGFDRMPTAYIIPMAAEQRTIDAAAEKMRSLTWTHADLDESAFYVNADELHNSLIPRTQGLGHISTPNGENYFHQLGLGDVHDELAARVKFHEVGAKALRRGVWQWERNGFSHLRVHYSAHPDRDPATETGRAWQKAMKSHMDSRLWEREQEISYDVEAGTPYFCDTERIVEAPQSYNASLPFVGGHDYSHAGSAFLAMQIRPWKNGPQPFRLHILQEVISEHSEIDPHVVKLKKARLAEFGPEAEWRDHGDYAANQRTSTGTIISVYQRHKVFLTTIPTGPGGVLKGTNIIQYIISQGMLEVDPHCEVLLKALRNSYTRNEDGTPTDMHPWCDVVDALRYPCINLIELVEGKESGRIIRFTGDFRSRQPNIQEQTNLPRRAEPGVVRPAGYRGRPRV